MLIPRTIRTFFPFALAVSIAAAAAGSLTEMSVHHWYLRLAKPVWTAPSQLFGPVWTILYTLMGISLWRLWILPHETASRPSALVLFAFQLILNAIWTPLFFGLHRMWAAFGVILALEAVLIACAALFQSLDPWAAYLFVPYLLWVGFASVLNYAVARLNT